MRGSVDLEMLACPVCKGALLESGNALLCPCCACTYGVIDGIPLLLPSSASVHDSAKEDTDSEQKHFDEYYRAQRNNPGQLIADSEWVRRAKNPSPLPLDFWEYSFYLAGPVQGRKVLELGCGGGWISRLLAYKGAVVSAVDISLQGCLAARDKLLAAGFQPDCIAVMDAHYTGFKDATFDVIFIVGVLHHMNTSKLATEVHRILKPGGRMVCYEPLRYGPLMWALRSIYLKLKGLKEYSTTEHEEALKDSDLDPFRQLFAKSMVKKMNFIGKTNRFKNRFGLLAQTLRWADYLLLSCFPFFQRYCTTVVCCFEK
jgi:SAM-dependent methyltransferase